MLKAKHVSWSPVVKPVSRPVSVKKRATPRTTTKFRSSANGLTSAKCGHLIAHSRKDTHSLLLTLRRGQHRDFQLLVDLPSRRIRRIYDGTTSWTVRDGQPTTMELSCTLGTVLWLDDNQRRRAATPGFRVDWLNGVHRICVAQARKVRRRDSRRAVSDAAPSRRARRSSRRRRTSRR
jgi:hypothetical protein